MKLKWPVILASASPRRQSLLKEILSEFSIVSPDIDEDAMSDADPWVTAQRLAREKALAVFEQHADSLVIAGDTVVAVPVEDGYLQLAKPVDTADAIRMLTLLQGRSHTVITGICIRYPQGMSAFTEFAEVTFDALSQEQIEDYVAGGEPMDKAGAYGYQGGASAFISQVKGDVNTVIGLPVERLRDALREIAKG